MAALCSKQFFPSLAFYCPHPHYQKDSTITTVNYNPSISGQQHNAVNPLNYYYNYTTVTQINKRYHNIL